MDNQKDAMPVLVTGTRVQILALAPSECGTIVGYAMKLLNNDLEPKASFQYLVQLDHQARGWLHSLGFDKTQFISVIVVHADNFQVIK